MTIESPAAAPGDPAGRPVTPHVALLLSFLNSVDLELGTDDLTTTRDLTSWLVGQGLLPRRTGSTGEDLALARRLRDALHEALLSHHDGVPDLRSIESAAVQLPLVLSSTGDRPGLRPLQRGVRGALSQIVIAVTTAVADDTWRRLKICSADTCRWAYFDVTKNRSRAWCEWGCGNKVKTRNYRARRKAAGLGVH